MYKSDHQSAEMDLKNLRNEGKISQSDYEELLGAMRKPAPGILSSRPRRAAKMKDRVALLSIISLISGLLLPLMFSMRGIVLASSIGLELMGFVMGLNSWPNTMGKVAVFSCPLMIVCVLSLSIRYWI